MASTLATSSIAILFLTIVKSIIIVKVSTIIGASRSELHTNLPLFAELVGLVSYINFSANI